MTSLLRKKLPTTVRNNTKHWMLSLLAGAAFSATSSAALFAQENVPVNPFRSQPRPAGQLRPINPTPTRADLQPEAQLQLGQSQPGQSQPGQLQPGQFKPREAQPLPSEPVGLGSGEVVLRWRASDKVTPIAPNASTTSQTASSQPTTNRAASKPSGSPTTTARVGQRPAVNASTQNRLRSNSVVPVSYQDPSLQQPSLQQPSPAGPPIATPGAPVSPLQDPFGDRGRAPVLPNLPPTAETGLQPPATSPLGNDALSTPEAAPLPKFPPADSGGQESAQPATEPNRFPGTLPPSPMPADIENAPMPMPVQPFDDQPALGNSREGREELQSPEVSASDRDDVLALPAGSAATGYSCDEIRSRLKSGTIDRIELDVSPRFGRGSRSTEATTQLQAEFASNAPVRTWYDRSGREIARGRLQDWRRNRAILDVDGEEVSILVTDLSDADVAYISDAWGVPHLCGLSNDDWRQREFSPIKMTWKSSELMHKPLYFEDVALERYGHSAGPIAQPVLSTGHFFANIAVLPYKMGIHPMSECQYALGYYRPGNCAPWQIPAVPLSGRGALMQAGVVTGMAGLLP